MKLAIATPVVTNVAGAPLTWEKDGSIEDIGRVAETADRLGYHHLTCSEHIGIPATEAGRRGARYWDPLATLGYVSARTQQIRLATMTLVLGYHHPLAIVKRYGTLDHVSGGQSDPGRRCRLPQGGVRPSRRAVRRSGSSRRRRTCGHCGPHCRAMNRCMPASTTRSAGSPSTPARYSRICRSGSVAEPNDRCGARSRLPTAGVRSAFRLPPLQSGCRRESCPPGFEVVLPADQPLDPVDEPDATRETLAYDGRGGHDDSVGAVHPPLARALPRADPRTR